MADDKAECQSDGRWSFQRFFGFAAKLFLFTSDKTGNMFHENGFPSLSPSARLRRLPDQP
jgi:hypothetical protein